MLNTKQKSIEKRSKLLIIFITLFVVILVVGIFVALYLAFQDDNEDRRYSNPSNAVVTKLAYSALLGKEVAVQSDEVNNFIAKQIEQKKTKETIKAINIKEGQDNSSANIYTYFNYNGINLSSTFDTEISLNKDGKIKFNIINAKIGRLQVPKSFAVNIIKEVLKDTVETQGTTVFTDSTFSLNEFSTEVSLTVEKLEFKDGQFILKLSGGIDALKKVLGDKLGRLLSFIRD